MALHLTQCVIAAACVVVYVVPANADDDPTFNGMLKTASCNYSTQAMCGPDGYCVPISVGPSAMFYLAFDMQHQLIYQNSGADASQDRKLKMTEISPAKIGAPLKVKFDVTVDKKPLSVEILLRPITNNFGNPSYMVTSGIVFTDGELKEMLYGACSLNTMMQSAQ